MKPPVTKQTMIQGYFRYHAETPIKICYGDATIAKLKRQPNLVVDISFFSSAIPKFSDVTTATS